MNFEHFPDDPTENLQLFRDRLAEYKKGGVARFELYNVIIPHAAVSDPAALYDELPEEFQEWLRERCEEFLSPETELFTVGSSVSLSSLLGIPPPVISDEKKCRMEEDRIASEQHYRKGHNRFYEFLRKTGKIPS